MDEQKPTKLDQMTTNASKKFSDWSVEIFLALVVVGLGAAFYFLKDKLIGFKQLK